jgi:hypothetical protein
MKSMEKMEDKFSTLHGTAHFSLLGVTITLGESVFNNPNEGRKYFSLYLSLRGGLFLFEFFYYLKCGRSGEPGIVLEGC